MSVCPRCGTEFSCGMVDKGNAPADAPCWCTQFPLLPLPAAGATPAAASCYCPACLEALTDAPRPEDKW